MRVYACLPFAAGAVPEAPAPWPVWSGSTTAKIRFEPMSRKRRVELWNRARDLDRQTRAKGHHGGAIGHAGLLVLHALLFDFLDCDTGRLDPSYAAIARKANVSERTVARAIQRLRELGILNWVPRCEPVCANGGFLLRQVTNAYAVLPETQWRGYRPRQRPPGPAPGTWGDHPPLPPALGQVAAARRTGARTDEVLQILASDPADTLAAVLARFGKAVSATEAAKA